MPITHIETLCLSRLHEPEQQWITNRFRAIKADCVIVIIRTSQGPVGIGEASPYGQPTLIRDWVDWLAPELIGRDPSDPAIGPHPNGGATVYQGSQLPVSPHDCAVGALDTALWDLRGKLGGQAVRDLIAAGARDRVPLYASSGCRYAWNARPEQLIEETLGYLAQGYTACKVRIGTDWAWDGVTTGRFLELMRALHAAVGGRMALMLDGNKRLTIEQSFEIARELDRLGFAWFEEPFSLEEIDDYVRLSASVDIPITAGEQLTTLEQFRPYIERHAVSVVQPDVACCGLTEALRIARMAERHDIELCPHNWHNGLMTLAHAQLVAAIPNTHVLELCMIQGPLQWGILADPPAILDGALELPDSPGLGVELAADLEQQFPYIDRHYTVPIDR
jgi:L-alanine-DL-glutamate epimerase-like enolase superfamily enzyme